MEKKSGIAAIILSGVIAFGIAGDIRPSTAASVSVSQPSEDTSSQNASSADSLNELCGMIMNAAALPIANVSTPETSSQETSSVVVNKTPVVYTKEEIKEAVHKKPTQEEQKKADAEDSQRVEQPAKEEEEAPIVILPTPPASSVPPASSTAPVSPSSTGSSGSSATSSKLPVSSSPAVVAKPKGWSTIGGKQYYSSDGISYLTGWQTINNRRYYFANSGAKTSLTGIDVSTWQNGTIDWKKVKADGIDYVMIRVGFRGNSTGSLVLDNRFEKHYAGAKAVGLKVGVYFFSQSINVQEAVDEAQFTLEVLKTHPIDYPVAYDIEDNSHRTAGLSNQMYTDMCKAFCSTIRSAGYTPQLYTYINYTKKYLNMSELTSYQMWIAHMGVPDNAITSYSHPYVAWQYSATGKVNGMLSKDGTAAKIDMNVMVPGGIEHTLQQSSSSQSSSIPSSTASSHSDSQTTSESGSNNQTSLTSEGVSAQGQGGNGSSNAESIQTSASVQSDGSAVHSEPSSD